MLHIISITFNTRITAYKKQGTLNRYSIQHLLLLACASPRTKSKGLHRYVLHILYLINQVCKKNCSLADIIIDGLARSLTMRVCLLLFFGTWGSKWAQDHHYHNRACRPWSTYKLHRLTIDQPAPHHDGRINKRRFTTHDQYMSPGFSHLVNQKYL
jgi:hypothetical protein